MKISYKSLGNYHFSFGVCIFIVVFLIFALLLFSFFLFFLDSGFLFSLVGFWFW